MQKTLLEERHQAANRRLDSLLNQVIVVGGPVHMEIEQLARQLNRTIALRPLRRVYLLDLTAADFISVATVAGE